MCDRDQTESVIAIDRNAQLAGQLNQQSFKRWPG
jgi:hypothetical protein